MENSGFRDDSQNRNDSIDKRIYSISMGRENVIKFMEEGDYSSSGSLDLFESIGSKLEGKIQETGGLSLFFFSITQESVSRDFSVLQIAHFLSKRGKRVLVVDCDFLEPGLSGLVENVEKHGFLDLLLYGSSLKSVAYPIGVEGVKVIGSGSFPVSRTVPFAKKEFERVNHFLRERSDVIIYCSTLYDDAKNINPLAEFVDEIILSSWVEETLDGRLQKALIDMETSAFSSVEAISFGGSVDKGSLLDEGAQPEEEKKEVIKKAKKVPDEEEKVVEETEEIGTQIAAGKENQDIETGFIEKTEEIETEGELPEKGVNPLRIVLITAIFFVVVFIAWWYIRGNSIKEDSSSERIGKAVQTMQEAGRDTLRMAAAENKFEEAVEDTIKNKGEKKETAENTIVRGQVVGKKAPGIPKKEGVAGKDGQSKESVNEVTNGTVSKPASDIYYSVHIASFRDLDKAGIEAEYFEKKGYDVYVMQAEVKHTRWFRVLIGRIPTQGEASKFKMQLLSLKKIGYARVIKMNK
ncbi:SPOR domain-containing protein [bacterium]|nr:SPOR domain-containing protein [bacterium]